MKKWIGLAAALLLILAGFYFGSAYYAVNTLRDAAREGDTDEIAAGVDFPAVRESLKSQLSTALLTKIHGDAKLRDNPFAAMGEALLPTIADRVVDALVTPDGVAALLRGQKPTDRDSPAANPDVEARSGYVSLDRFRVSRGEDGPSFMFERRGFANWKLVRIEVPPRMLGEKL